MIVNVVRTGNSKCVRIPKSMLEQCGIGDSVRLQLNCKRIALTPVKTKPRQGWAEEARRMHEAGDDGLLIPDVLPDDPHVPETLVD